TSRRAPAARTRNKDTMIARLPNAPESRQLRWTERPKPEPKPFEAPDMISVRRRAVRMEIAPQLAPEAAGQLKAAELAVPKLAPKPFVAPGSSSKQPSREVRRITISDAPALTPQMTPAGLDMALSAVMAASRVKTPKPFTAPEGKKPGAAAGAGTVPEIGEAPRIVAGGASDVNALALNTVHAALANELPPMSNSQASAGPRTGAEGGAATAGLRIPGVTVQPGTRVPAGGSGSAAVLQDIPPPFIASSVAPLQQTFSAPLAPSSRSIPAAIEARFHQRVVYTVVLPMRKVPGYGADWIMWFAEHEPASDGAPRGQMRAPLPMRKIFRANAAASADLPARIQVTATINRDGIIEQIGLIGAPAGSASDAAIEDLKSWQFLPALRNRVPVDADVVIEITFANPENKPKGHSRDSTPGN
ncbi:MAG TPA: energy transducer TonB, partial [Bryobacteraceae bacterium]|nr:energy transducer TonB [Bryobacteraceae bacterium]